MLPDQWRSPSQPFGLMRPLPNFGVWQVVAAARRSAWEVGRGPHFVPGPGCDRQNVAAEAEPVGATRV